VIFAHLELFLSRNSRRDLAQMACYVSDELPVVCVVVSARIQAENDVAFINTAGAQCYNNEVSTWLTESEPVDVGEQRLGYLFFH